MSDNNTRTLLERACAKAVDIMLTGDDVATVRQATGHHVVIIRTVESDEREARTIQRREEHAEHVRETGAAELLAASEALASAAAEVDALRVELARQTGIAVDHCARADVEANCAAEMEAQANREQDRADAAEQMVVELRGLLQSAHQAVVHEAGKRCDAAIAARDEAVHHADEVVHAHNVVMDDMRARLESAIHDRDEAVAKLESARRARDEVGIQLAAAQAEIARMRPVVEAARRLLWSWDEGSTATERSRQHEDIRRALRALDAVPGDALAPRITAALEASGIDTANVKGVE